MKTAISILRVIIFSAILSSCISSTTVKVAENERGVMFKKFGGGIDTTEVLLPGEYNIAEYDRMYIYNIDEQEGEELVEIRFKDGVEASFNLKYKFKPIAEKIPLLHYYIGNNYTNSLVKNAIQIGIKEELEKQLSTDFCALSEAKQEEILMTSAKNAIKRKFIQWESMLIEKSSLACD